MLMPTVTFVKPRRRTPDNSLKAWEVRADGELVGFLRSGSGQSYWIADRTGRYVERTERTLGQSRQYIRHGLDNAKACARELVEAGKFPTPAAIARRDKEDALARAKRREAARERDRIDRLESYGPRLYEVLKLMLNGTIVLSDAQIKSARDLLAEIDAPIARDDEVAA